MARRWRELKKIVSRWATHVGALVSNTASLILRRHNTRQVGVIDSGGDPLLVCQLSNKLDTYEDDLDKIPDTFDSYDDNASLGSIISDTVHEDFSSVLLIPYDCRAILYEYVDFPDVLSLRLTCKQIFYELNYCRGVRLKLDDTRANYDWFRHTGVGSLTIRHFRSDTPEIYGLLKRPQLLKELVISGSISPDNFNWIVSTCQNIQKFAVEISPYSIRYEIQSFYMDTMMPKNVTTLRLSAFMYDRRDAEHTSDNLFPILNNLRANNLCQFTFQLVIIDSQSLENFHLEALKFIQRHSATLKVLQIQIKQVFVAVLTSADNNNVEDLLFTQWIQQLQLQELRLTLDRHLGKWMPIVHAQTQFLVSLELNLRNLAWNTLIPVFNQCANTLRNLQAYNINVREAHRIHPIDLGVLRNCKHLEKLTLHHQEHSPIFHPKISRTAHLPCSLVDLDLSRLLVKQHQMLFILIRLPRLRRLELAYWSDTESYFASLLSLLPLLIRFNVTSITSVTLLDLRRKFENRHSEMTRMTNFLKGLATVQTSDAVRETRVTIQVKSFHDVHNYSNCGSVEMI